MSANTTAHLRIDVQELVSSFEGYETSEVLSGGVWRMGVAAALFLLLLLIVYISKNSSVTRGTVRLSDTQ